MFQKISEAINVNLAIYIPDGYYNKVFKEEYTTDFFYILLNKKYAVEISVNYMDDIISFMLLKLDEGGKIDESDGYSKFNNGDWKRELIQTICNKLNIQYNKDLLKQVHSLNQRYNKDKNIIINRIDMYFKIFEIFFKDYKKYLDGFDKL